MAKYQLIRVERHDNPEDGSQPLEIKEKSEIFEGSHEEALDRCLELELETSHEHYIHLPEPAKPDTTAKTSKK